MTPDPLRKHLIELLQGGQAHAALRDVVNDFPTDRAGIRPNGSPHSAWELLEHIRIALRDIVLFSGLQEKSRESHSRQPPAGYVELKWPEDYWPQSQAPSDSAEWNASIAAIEADMHEFLSLLDDPSRDLLQPFPWGQGQTLLREALLIADHASYHLGQMMLVRRMLESEQ